MDEVFLSFNGGKDCTVLLDLIARKFPDDSLRRQIQCWYIEPDSEPSLEEVDAFVGQCEKNYRITIHRIKGRIKDALEVICSTNPRLKACIMGSRRTDPYCEKLESFQKTDPGWVELMRINPILDWTCDNIWDYLLTNKVPYCTLYDVGYTSLGHKNNTRPNPHLRFIDPDTNQVGYRPAYTLRNSDHLERAGRSK